MAKTYQALVDVSIPKPVTQLDPDKPDSDWVTEGATYAAGSLISEDWLTPRDRKRIENGELSHLFQESDQEIPEGYTSGGVFNEPETGVFIAEHEAERTALEAGGHVVVPDDQKMELLSSSAEHDRQYQEAVKEQGYDRRPVLEHLQQERPRVPEEMLHGRETGAGVQHYRGQAGGQGEALESVHAAREESSDNSEENTEGEASRPAPGSTENRQQEADSQTVGSGE